jgi:hypothetical protein
MEILEYSEYKLIYTLKNVWRGKVGIEGNRK